MRHSFVLLILLAVGFSGCNTHNETAKTDKPAAAPKEPTTNLDKEHTTQLMGMLSDYYSLKDALVAGDSIRAEASASKLVSSAEDFQNGIGGRPEATELEPQLQKVMKAGDSSLAIKGSPIEAQRSHFSAISEAMTKVLHITKLQHAGVYEQHCPMAFEGKGGNWLSNEAEIKNPYYGKRMLECGDVRDSF